MIGWARLLYHLFHVLGRQSLRNAKEQEISFFKRVVFSYRSSNCLLNGQVIVSIMKPSQKKYPISLFPRKHLHSWLSSNWIPYLTQVLFCKLLFMHFLPIHVYRNCKGQSASGNCFWHFRKWTSFRTCHFL